MKTKFLFAIFCGLSLQQCNQAKKERREYVVPEEFSAFLANYQQQQKLFEEQPLPLPLLYKEDSARVGMNYRVVLGDKALGLAKREIVLHNPFAAKPFPLSFSVIYRNCLVVLFEPGQFACYQVGSLARNRELEGPLNSRKFQYHWLIGDNLVGLSNGKYFSFTSDNKWIPYAAPIPFNKQPKLFEDNKYLSFLTCNGEWGGEVYFYDKQLHTYYFTGATCPNTVFKRDGKYYVLSSLGHGGGSTAMQLIAQPALLTKWSGKGKPQDRKVEYGMSEPDTVGASKIHTAFYYYGLQIFSSFQFDGTQLYLVFWNNRTFLATVKDGIITLVDPLFENNLYTHNPVTVAYAPDTILVNLDFYGIAAEKEVSCLLISGKQLVKINWSKETESMR